MRVIVTPAADRPSRAAIGTVHVASDTGALSVMKVGPAWESVGGSSGTTVPAAAAMPYQGETPPTGWDDVSADLATVSLPPGWIWISPTG